MAGKCVMGGTSNRVQKHVPMGMAASNFVGSKEPFLHLSLVSMPLTEIVRLTASNIKILNLTIYHFGDG